MDQLGKVGVVPPPEEPELPTSGPLAPSPHTQHVRFDAAAEAAQDGVLLGHREEDGCRGGALPHVPLPFDPRQVRLRGRRERESQFLLHSPVLSTKPVLVSTKEQALILLYGASASSAGTLMTRRHKGRQPQEEKNRERRERERERRETEI